MLKLFSGTDHEVSVRVFLESDVFGTEYFDHCGSFAECVQCVERLAQDVLNQKDGVDRRVGIAFGGVEADEEDDGDDDDSDTPDAGATQSWGKADGVWHLIAEITGPPYGATRTCRARCGRMIEAGSRTLIDLPSSEQPGRKICRACSSGTTDLTKGTKAWRKRPKTTGCVTTRPGAKKSAKRRSPTSPRPARD